MSRADDQRPPSHRIRRTGLGDMGRVAVLLVIGLGLASCAIRPDSEPREVSAENTIPATGETILPTDSTGDARIYLVAPSEPGQQRKLRAVTRDVPATPLAIIDALWAGPNQSELDKRLVSVIPSDSDTESARRPPSRIGNTLFLDIPPEINQLTGEALTLAVAQIVFTAAGLPGIQFVNLRVGSEDQAWPRGDGQSKTGDLTIYDFPGFVDSTQPPFPAVPAIPTSN